MANGFARADYPDGGFRTVAGAGPGYGGGGGGGGMPGMPPWFAQAMQSRIAQQQQEMALAAEQARMQNEMMRFQMEEAKRAASAARAPKLGTWDSPQGIANQTGRLGLRQARAQTRMLEGQERAMGGPAPTRMVTGPGVIPGPTMDPFKMSGYQRQAFLPQESTEIGGPVSDIERGAYGAARGQQRADVAGIADMRSWMSGGVPGFSGQPFGGYAGPESPPARAQGRAQDRSRRRQGAGGIGGGQPAGGGAGSLF